MFRIEQKLDLDRLILHSKLQKKDIANLLNIRPQAFNRLLRKDIDEWSLKNLQAVLSILGYDLTILVQQRKYGKYPIIPKK